MKNLILNLILSEKLKSNLPESKLHSMVSFPIAHTFHNNLPTHFRPLEQNLRTSLEFESHWLKLIEHKVVAVNVVAPMHQKFQTFHIIFLLQPYSMLDPMNDLVAT